MGAPWPLDLAGREDTGRNVREEAAQGCAGGGEWGALSKSLVEKRREGQMFLYYFLGLEERLFRDAMMLIVGCLTKRAFCSSVFCYT